MHGFKPFTEEIYEYMLSVSLRENDIQKQLREQTVREVREHVMLTNPEQVQFLQFLVELTGAKKAIEVGVFTGYGSLAIAQALPADGKLVACDIGSVWPSIGKPFWEAAGVAQKIDLRIAPAAQTLQALLDEGLAKTFDFVFIDADKIHYKDYYEYALKLVRKGGLIAFDNTLWMEDPVNTLSTPAARGVDAVSRLVHNDDRVTSSMLPIAGGMLLARVRD